MQIKCARPQTTAGLINYSDLVFPVLLLRNIAAIILSKYSRVQGPRYKKKQKKTKHKQQQSVRNKCDKMKQTNSESLSRAAVTTNTTPRTSSPDSVSHRVCFCCLSCSPTCRRSKTIWKKKDTQSHTDRPLRYIICSRSHSTSPVTAETNIKMEREREGVEAGLGVDKKITPTNEISQEKKVFFQQPLYPEPLLLKIRQLFLRGEINN